MCIPTGHLDSLSHGQTQIGKTVGADTNGSVKKKKRKKHKDSTGQCGTCQQFAASVSSRLTHAQIACCMTHFSANHCPDCGTSTFSLS